jgi:imidazolonepropionase
MDLFLRNIGQLVTVPANGAPYKNGPAMNELGIIRDAGVLCRHGRIEWVGPMADWAGTLPEDMNVLDASGSVVLPGFVDAHTHAMFAGDRAEEFGKRAAGATYRQIGEQGGGILYTMRQVRAATKKELKRRTARYLNEMMRHGTTTVEIKTGYGLDMDSEIKMLEGIAELRDEEMIGVVPTFLPAHAFPPEFTSDHQAYVDLILQRMLPYAGGRRLAEFCDVFCEQGYFDTDQTTRILEEGKRWGMKPKVHAEELQYLGGARVAGEVGAVSADHLEHVTPEGIEALRDGGVVAVLLPGVSFFLNHGYAPARALIDGGVPVAIATDFNPGSCMSFSLPLMMTIACTHMRMSPEEAITAITLNAAAAVGRSAECGSIETGKQADLVVADVPDYRHLAYHFGVNHVRHTIKSGTLLEF